MDKTGPDSRPVLGLCGDCSRTKTCGDYAEAVVLFARTRRPTTMLKCSDYRPINGGNRG
jgi:hypothetical protein